MDTRRFPQFADYFNKLLKEKEPKASQENVAEKFGVKQGTISKIVRGMLVPSDDLAEKIARIWEVEDFCENVLEARRTDTLKALRNAKPRQEVEIEDVAKQPTKPRLPVSAAAGSLSQYSQGVLLEQCEQMPIIRNFPDYDYTMFIKGNSMEPKYESGDEIAIKKAEFVVEWGKDYVLDTEDGVIFKKIYDEGANIRCVSYNHEEYPDFLVPKEIIFGFYKFVGLVRV
jgi:phage repressor protein C with HTH and peptisase S24 domain